MTRSTDPAAAVRAHVVEMCCTPGGGHLGGSLSLVDVLVALYFDVLRVDPARPGDPNRDVLLLSKGHGALALYATLAERGFLDPAELRTYGQAGGRFSTHPTTRTPGVELPTGSLGHGLPLGLGYALAARLAATDRRTVVIMGDGELQEGSCWEAIAVAAAKGVDRLVAVVDRNGLQLTGATDDIVGLEPLADRWTAFGWAVREVDGHDRAALAGALAATPWEPGRPSVLIARTTKGFGIPLLAGQPTSHYVMPSRQQAELLRAAVRLAATTGNARG